MEAVLLCVESEYRVLLLLNTRCEIKKKLFSDDIDYYLQNK